MRRNSDGSYSKCLRKKKKKKKKKIEWSVGQCKIQFNEEVQEKKKIQENKKKKIKTYSI